MAREFLDASLGSKNIIDAKEASIEEDDQNEQMF